VKGSSSGEASASLRESGIEYRLQENLPSAASCMGWQLIDKDMHMVNGRRCS